MKLSEAIRLGAMSLPPVRQMFFKREKDGLFGGACAIGTALWAVGDAQDYADWHSRGLNGLSELRRFWPWVTQDVVVEIIHRYDYGHETREQIADWVATIEPVEPSTAPAPIEAAVPVR